MLLSGILLGFTLYHIHLKTPYPRPFLLGLFGLPETMGKCRGVTREVTRTLSGTSYNLALPCGDITGHGVQPRHTGCYINFLKDS